MSGVVLITRPSPAAEAFRTTLALHGISALLAPLLTYQPLAQPLPTAAWDGVIFTSAAAVRLLNHALLPTDWQNQPCYCVGPATAALARAQGWRNIRQGSGDGAALALQIAQEQRAGGCWLHPCGQERQTEPAQSLLAADIHALPWPVYEAVAATVLPAVALAALRDRRLTFVTLFSPRTAQIFVALTRAAALTELCRTLTAVSLSPAIAAVAADLPWRDNRSAATPSEAALLSSLQNLLRR